MNARSSHDYHGHDVKSIEYLELPNNLTQGIPPREIHATNFNTNMKINTHYYHAAQLKNLKKWNTLSKIDLQSKNAKRSKNFPFIIFYVHRNYLISSIHTLPLNRIAS